MLQALQLLHLQVDLPPLGRVLQRSALRLLPRRILPPGDRCADGALRALLLSPLRRRLLVRLGHDAVQHPGEA